MFVSAKAIRKPSHQPIGVLRVRTIALILSVTVMNVCPGAITAGGPAPTTARFGSSIGWRLSAMSDKLGTERAEDTEIVQPWRHGDTETVVHEQNEPSVSRCLCG